MDNQAVRTLVLAIVKRHLDLTKSPEDAVTFESIGADSLDVVEISLEVGYEIGLSIGDEWGPDTLIGTAIADVAAVMEKHP